MAETGIRIDGLPPIGVPLTPSYVFPAMLDGVTVQLTIGQLLDLIVDGAPGALDTLYELAEALGNDPEFATTLAALIATKADGATTTAALSALSTSVGLKADKADLVFGQCELILSGGNLTLVRRNGRFLTINGAQEVVPSVGPTLAATGLTPGTLYYIYAYMNSGTLALEASATGHSTDASTGVEIKTGDASRTLVGMARPVAGPAWADSISQRFVRSWFNRPAKSMRKAFTANRSTTATGAFAEVNAEIRCEWIQWAGEVPTAHIQGTASNNTANIYALTAIGWDGAADSHTSNSISSATGIAYNCSTSAPKEGLAEGYHYATLMGMNASASTSTWLGGVVGTFTSLSVRLGA